MFQNNFSSYYATFLPFLLSFVTIFHLYALNTVEISLVEFLLMLGIYLIFCLLIYILIRILIKDNIKSSLITTVVIFLNSMNKPSLLLLQDILNVETAIRNYRIVVFGVIIIIGFVIAYLIYKSRYLHNVLKIAYSFVFVLLVFSIITYSSQVINNITQTEYYHHEVCSLGITEEDISMNAKDKCDVYFIILDAYTGNKQLKKYFNYDNNEFYEELHHRGFYIAGDSRSNYTQTCLSIPATLNMEYFKDSVMSKKQMDILLDNTMVMELFSRLGYETHCNRNLKGVDHWHYTGMTPFFMEALLQNYAGQILKELGFVKKKGSKQILNDFNLLHNLATRMENDYIFVYTHLMIPHPPYYFKPNGELYKDIEFDWNKSDSNDRYIDQIKFTNKRILKLIDEMLQRNPCPVILLQADHGKQSAAETKSGNDGNVSFEKLDQFTGNLNAMYYPDSDYSLLYKNITSINTFTVFFKKFVNPAIELKDDISYFHKYLNSNTIKIIDISEFGLNNQIVESGDSNDEEL